MKHVCMILSLFVLCVTFPTGVLAQDAQVGLTVPVTVSGGVIETARTKADDPDAARLSAGFRVLATPQATFGRHLYFYSTIQVHSEPFFYQDRYSTEREVEIQTIQGFLGYTHLSEKASFGVKAGKLTSAFGAFPLKYDDATNPLIDQPLSYGYMKLRADQLPCGVHDFSDEPEPDVDFHCGGADEESYGVAPVTLYGLPGAQVEGSWRRLDARFQLTSSSPANPLGVGDREQHLQWTAGGGYTVRQGFRIGVSAHRGPWLDRAVKPYIENDSIADFPATGLGVDGQWAGGSWSVSGELQRFEFSYPAFTTDPAANFGYVEVKRILGARWYSALRANYQMNNKPADSTTQSTTPFLPNRQAYEFAVGFRPNRLQLLKAGYERTNVSGDPHTHDNIFGVQLVTTLNAFSKALK